VPAVLLLLVQMSPRLLLPPLVRPARLLLRCWQPVRCHPAQLAQKK
jgi:hypothetical protein